MEPLSKTGALSVDSAGVRALITVKFSLSLPREEHGSSHLALDGMAMCMGQQLFCHWQLSKLCRSAKSGPGAGRGAAQEVVVRPQAASDQAERAGDAPHARGRHRPALRRQERLRGRGAACAHACMRGAAPSGLMCSPRSVAPVTLFILGFTAMLLHAEYGWVNWPACYTAGISRQCGAWVLCLCCGLSCHAA